ncbi:MAG: HAMP domain-containing protein [Gammaproteobacteria bacterium]|nr:MAG: HAMP domain-containing protein [Gammaproteobacteria bacterium]
MVSTECAEPVQTTGRNAAFTWPHLLFGDKDFYTGNMSSTLSKKLNASFLGLTVVVLAATLGLARWSFDKGFIGFINSMAQHRLERIAAQLVQDYQQAGNSWDALTPSRFEEILRIHSYRPHPNPNNEPHRPIFSKGPRPPEPPEDSFNEPPNGPPDGPKERGHPPPFPPPFAADKAPEPSAAPRRFSGLGPPTTLLDASGHIIAGVPLEQIGHRFTSVPIIVNGHQVGELRSILLRRPDTAQQAAFSRQQWITSLFIAAAALALAALVSFFLSRKLLAPIQRLIGGAKQLAQGDYQFRMNEDRHDELGQLIQNMNILATKLEENRSARKRWLADISHELRTPVTVLTGEIEAIKDGIRPLTLEHIDSLYQEINRLRHLIDDLYQLSLSDIGGLNYTFSPLNLTDTIQPIIHRIRHRADKKGILIKTDIQENVCMQGDSQRLEQLFTILLENALLYTDTPGEILLTVRSSSQSVQILIDDTPPGINEEDCEKLFDPLYRLESSRSRSRGGAGLGLAIGKNIVKAHQGQIKASPSPMGGVRIEIKFPAHRHNNE